MTDSDNTSPALSTTVTHVPIGTATSSASRDNRSDSPHTATTTVAAFSSTRK